ncbi:MAG: outer membrane lipoprotein carrier protein LolA [Geobacteraceae bacterium]|nr:outer membrane lipoprotein carrier protein LolA [Geobacteraceae bacterium]
MQRLFRLLVLLTAIIVLAASSAAAAGATPNDVVAALEKGYGALSDLHADFSQRTAIASLNREERGAGELFIKKAAGGAAMFRFNYSKPRQQIISNGKTVWYYLPENKQVMVSDVAALFEGGNAMALNYLTGMGQLSADFTAEFAEGGRDKKGNYVIDLVPRKKSPVLAKLRLTVSARAVEEFLAAGTVREPFPVISSVVYDQLGNRTRIDYGKVRVNLGIGSDRFNFKVPAGVEVIKTK